MTNTVPDNDSRVVCSEHFADAAYSCPARRYSDSKLLDQAVPSMFKFSSAPASKRKAPAKRFALAPKKKAKIDVAVEVEDTVAAVTPRPRTGVNLKWRPAAATSSAIRTRLWRAKKRMRQLKDELSQSRSADTAKQDLLDSLPSQQRPFIGLQLRMIGKLKVRAYTKEEQEFALALYHRGPAAYKMMRSIFWLPSVSVLLRLMRSCMSNPGPCSILLQALEGEMEKCDPAGRIGTLGFDAMSLTPAVRYEEHHDRIGGFEQVGPDVSGRTPRIANQGLAAVVRTVRDHCKMPIGFDLIENNPSQRGFGQIVNNYLEAAHTAGMRIVSITCDQERTQWAWLKGMNTVETYF